MPGELRPIETIYNGHRFRSRLEARWAVFFDSAGIDFHYELEGFDLGLAGAYLPDFWLPAHALWVEIKPEPPAVGEAAKLIAFGRALSADPRRVERGESFVVLAGQPYAFESVRAYQSLHVMSGWPQGQPDRLVDLGMCWCECPLCNRISLSYFNPSLTADDEAMYCVWCDVRDRWMQPETETAYFHKGDSVSRIPGRITDSNRLRGAYIAARYERFERRTIPRIQL